MYGQWLVENERNWDRGAVTISNECWSNLKYILKFKITAIADQINFGFFSEEAIFCRHGELWFLPLSLIREGEVRNKGRIFSFWNSNLLSGENYKNKWFKIWGITTHGHISEVRSLLQFFVEVQTTSSNVNFLNDGFSQIFVIEPIDNTLPSVIFTGLQYICPLLLGRKRN